VPSIGASNKSKKLPRCTINRFLHLQELFLSASRRNMAA